MSSYLDKNGLTTVDERGGEYDFAVKHAVEPETIRNFLKPKSPTSISRAGEEKRPLKSESLRDVSVKTMQFVDLYCQCAYPEEKIHPRTNDFLMRLGRLTAMQYRPELSHIDPAQSALVGSRKILLAPVADINIISPVKIKALLIYLFPAPDRAFSIVQVFCISRWDGTLDGILSDSKREWLQEHYGGIGIITRDGVSCHLNSKTLHIPLYGIFRLDSDLAGQNPNDLNIRFFDYSEEIKDFGNTVAKTIDDNRLYEILDNIGWYI